MNKGEPMNIILSACDRDWHDDKFVYFIDCFKKALQVRAATIYNLTINVYQENLEDKPQLDGYRVFFITRHVANTQSLLGNRLEDAGSNCAIADYAAIPLVNGLIPESCYKIGFYEASQPESEVQPNTLRFFLKMDEFIHRFRKANELKGITGQTSVQSQSNVILSAPANAFTALQDNLSRDLRFHDFKVFISGNESSGNTAAKELSEEAFKAAFLSVHLVPENIRTSGLQPAQLGTLQTASGRLKQNGRFETIIWSPLSRNEAPLVERLKDLDIINQPRVDFIQCPPETLKSIVLERAQKISTLLAKPAASRVTDAFKKVYFIYDNADEELFQTHKRMYEASDVEVLSTNKSGNDRKLHQQYLVDCEAVVLYAEKASDMWLRMKLMDVIKSPGWGRTKPIRPKALLKVSGKKLPPLPLQDFSVLEFEAQSGDEAAKLVMGLLSIN